MYTIGRIAGEGNEAKILPDRVLLRILLCILLGILRALLRALRLCPMYGMTYGMKIREIRRFWGRDTSDIHTPFTRLASATRARGT
jgi:hypothetical protein